MSQTPGGGGLLGDIARAFAHTSEEADELRKELVRADREACLTEDGPMRGTFRAFNAQTPDQREQVVDHFRADPPHLQFKEKPTPDGGVTWEHLPTNPEPQCLVCAEMLRNDGRQTVISAQLALEIRHQARKYDQYPD